MYEFALFTAAGIDWLNKFKANQQQSAIGATASACEGPIANSLYGSPQAERRIREHSVQASQKRLGIEARQRKHSRKRRSEGRQGWPVP